LRDACMAVALNLGGWKKAMDRPGKRGKSVSTRVNRVAEPGPARALSQSKIA